MKTTAAATAITIALGVGTVPAAEAGDRHGKWADKSRVTHGYDRGHHKYERGHRKGARHDRHGKRYSAHRGHRYRDHERGYRGKGKHHRKHGYRHYRPYGDRYTRRHHSYGSGIGLNIDGVMFIWSERHYR